MGKLNEYIRQHSDSSDVDIQYEPGTKIAALYDRTLEEIRKFTDDCRDICPDVVIKEIK